MIRTNPKTVPADFESWRKKHFYNPEGEQIKTVPFEQRKLAPNYRTQKLNALVMQLNFNRLKKRIKWD